MPTPLRPTPAFAPGPARLAPVVLLLTLFLAAEPASPQPRPGTGPGTGDPGAEKRLALVIGNAAYATSPLRNPVNDARAIAATLGELGFEVLAHENLGQRDMRRAILRFGEHLREDGGVGLFYFAGHGVQASGRNYLIPTDAVIGSEAEIEIEAVDVATVLGRMESAKNRLNIAILDACRDNPFARRFRTANRGLASIDAPSGTIIAYATAPGRVAADGAGVNGLYTSELLKAVRLPGLSIEEVFKQTRRAVQAASRGEQVPWESSSLVGAFFFAPAAAPIVALAPGPSASPPPPAASAPGPTVRSVPRKGGIVVQSPREVVDVTLGSGQHLGQAGPVADLLIDGLPAGRHRLVATAGPGRRWEQDVSVVAGPPTAVIVNLDPAPVPAPVSGSARPPSSSSTDAAPGGQPGRRPGGAAEVAAIRPEPQQPAAHSLAGSWTGRGIVLRIAGTELAPRGSLTADTSAAGGSGVGDTQAQMVAFREIGHRDIENVTVRGRRLAFTAKGSSSTLHVELEVASDGRSMSGWGQYGSFTWRLSLTRE